MSQLSVLFCDQLEIFKENILSPVPASMILKPYSYYVCFFFSAGSGDDCQDVNDEKRKRLTKC